MRDETTIEQHILNAIVRIGTILDERLPKPDATEARYEREDAEARQGDPDESLARVLFDVSEDHGDGTFAWSTALAMARAAREHIEAERDVRSEVEKEAYEGRIDALEVLAVEQQRRAEKAEDKVQRLEESVAAWKSEVVKSARRQAVAMAERDEQKARAEEAEAERDEFNGFWKDALADVRKARDERDGAVKRYGALWADVKNAPFDTIFTKKLQGGILARADERGASRNEHRRSPLPHQPPRTTPRSAT